MKTKEHTVRPKVEYMVLRGEPLRVWLTSKFELIIARGDELLRIARVIERVLETDRSRALQIAAYYFALGERQYRGRMGEPWTKKELDVRIHRRYLEGTSPRNSHPRGV